MNEQQEKNPQTDNDGGWKQIINTHLKDFVEFFWLEAYENIDWQKPYEFLEQELLSIGIPEAVGKHYVDKLFKVYLKKSGEEQWILLHIEIVRRVSRMLNQGRYETEAESLLGIHAPSSYVKGSPTLSTLLVSNEYSGMQDTKANLLQAQPRQYAKEKVWKINESQLLRKVS